MEKDKIIVDGVEYVRADSIQNNALATELNGMPYCMVRTYSAGVFAGYLESREGKEATLRNARRIWYWDGAASLSQLATDGTSKPENCKFPCPVDSVTLTEVIEIIPITKKAKKSIEEVAVWKM
jgi:hypothetical protein|nr:MAG TPA: hypothetical protein [Caudoviricetes sp.]